jgi:predicted nucleic acid-binding Zn ribbon protein
MIKAIKCSVCKKKIINPNPRQRTCSPKCAKMHKDRYQKEYQKKYRKLNKK